MIIYIYGSDSFKKEINSVLDHSNIKFRLDEHSKVIDLETLDDLKNAIEENPNNIYLIDDSKIIKKNALNQKIKFLKPKDGIEEEYLLDNGIGDVCIDSIDELSKHIINKLESMPSSDTTDDIQDSIVEIVEDAYGQDNDDFDSVELDDELSELLSASVKDDEEITNDVESIDEIQIPEILEEKLEEEIENNSNEDSEDLKDLSFDEDLDNINEIDNKNIIEEDSSQGEKMADEFSEFDTLSESDILAALDGLDNVTVSKDLKNEAAEVSQASSSNNSSLNLEGSNTDDIAKLITQLLNNKTLEITIKVKE